MPSPEELGFEASVEVEGATRSLGQMEASVRSLLAAIEEVSAKGGTIPAFETDDAKTSIGRLEASFEALAKAGVASADGIGKAMTDMAATVTTAINAMAASAVSDLQQIDRQLLATQELLDRLAQSQVKLGLVSAPAGAGGSPQHAPPASGPVGGGGLAFTPPAHPAGPLVSPPGMAIRGPSGVPLHPVASTTPAAPPPSTAGAAGAHTFSLPGPAGSAVTFARAAAPGPTLAGFGHAAAVVMAGGGGHQPPVVAPPIGAGASGPNHAALMNVVTMHVATMHVGRQQNAGGTNPNNQPNRPPRQGFAAGLGNMVGGLAGMIGLGGIVAYMANAVREEAEEVVRVANMSTRFAPGAGGGDQASAMRAQMLGAGRPFMFTREESLDFGEGIASRMGRNRGVPTADLRAGLAFTRGFGMNVGETSQFFGEAGKKGIFGQSELREFSGQMAAAIDKSNMLARASEAMEAAADVMGDVSSRIGDLNASQRAGMLALTAKLAQGPEMFRGAQGAQFIRSIADVMRPGGGTERSDTMINMALVRHFGTKGMTPYKLMEMREGPLDSEKMKAFGEFVNTAGKGLGREGRLEMMRQLMGGRVGYTQMDTLEKLTKGFTDFGNVKGINAAAGIGVVQRGLSRQNAAVGGQAKEVRTVEQMSEDLRHLLGGALLPAFKTMQKGALDLGLFFVNKAIPLFNQAIPYLKTGVEKLSDFGKMIMPKAQVIWDAFTTGAATVTHILEEAGKKMKDAFDALFGPNGMFGGKNPIATYMNNKADELDKEGGVENKAKALALRGMAKLFTVDQTVDLDKKPPVYPAGAQPTSAGLPYGLGAGMGGGGAAPAVPPSYQPVSSPIAVGRFKTGDMPGFHKGHLSAFHYGVDIPAMSGTPVKAARGGTVEVGAQRGPTKTGYYGLGKWVTVKFDDGTYGVYGHLSNQSVKNGQRVEAGQVLGASGATGGAGTGEMGPHLHFERWKSEAAYNYTMQAHGMARAKRALQGNLFLDPLYDLPRGDLMRAPDLVQHVRPKNEVALPKPKPKPVPDLPEPRRAKPGMRDMTSAKPAAITVAVLNQNHFHGVHDVGHLRGAMRQVAHDTFQAAAAKHAALFTTG